MFYRLKAENKKFVKLTRSNHVLLFDYDREQVIDNFMRFVADEKGSGSL